MMQWRGQEINTECDPEKDPLHNGSDPTMLEFPDLLTYEYQRWTNGVVHKRGRTDLTGFCFLGPARVRPVNSENTCFEGISTGLTRS